MPVLAARTEGETLASSLEVPSVAEAWSTAWTQRLTTSSRCAVTTDRKTLNPDCTLYPAAQPQLHCSQ